MKSNNIINIEELINNNKSIKFKEDYFNKVLNKCHKLIQRYNKTIKIKSCHFNVPEYEFGIPLYNYNELLMFLYNNLKNNGLYVKILKDEKKLYISWDEKLIDINQYNKIKKELEENKLVNLIEKPSEIINTNKNKNKNNEDNYLLISNNIPVPVNKNKYLQAQKVQQEREKYYKNLVNNNNKDNTYTNFLQYNK